MTVVVYLVHHAAAVGAETDAQRPLSARGLAQAGWLAEQVKAAGFHPQSIWHSGKLRARQTAEAFLRACNPMASFRMVRGLAPSDPPEWLRDTLAAETDDLLLVGHWPHLPALLQTLAPDAREFPLNGLVALERTDEGWIELWRAQP